MDLKANTSHEEGCERHLAIAAKAFIGEADGRLKALRVVDLEWVVTDGRPTCFMEGPCFPGVFWFAGERG